MEGTDHGVGGYIGRRRQAGWVPREAERDSLHTGSGSRTIKDTFYRAGSGSSREG